LGQGRGWAGEEKRKGEGKGREGKWRGGKGRAPQSLATPLYRVDRKY